MSFFPIAKSGCPILALFARVGCDAAGTSFGEAPKRAPFWQSRFYDFNVWTDRKRVEKLGYMHGNPVKRGLVADPDDWRWSSYRFYFLGEVGLVRVNEGWGKISFAARVA